MNFLSKCIINELGDELNIHYFPEGVLLERFGRAIDPDSVVIRLRSRSVPEHYRRTTSIAFSKKQFIEAILPDLEAFATTIKDEKPNTIRRVIVTPSGDSLILTKAPNNKFNITQYSTLGYTLTEFPDLDTAGVNAILEQFNVTLRFTGELLNGT